MAITIREPVTPQTEEIGKAFEPYELFNQGVEIDIYRYNSISIRIRVIDPAFAGMGKVERHERIWEYLEKLPEDVLSDVSMIVSLAPGEEAKSISNLEFENPSPPLGIR